MKVTHLSLVLSIALLNGCALLSPDMTEEERYENDPVGRAALALRNDRSPAGRTTDYSSMNNRGDGNAHGREDNGDLESRAVSSERQVPDQLTLGMSSHHVQALWGRPQEIENAGDSDSGNQRWIYLNGLKRGWGTSDYRVVYFERNQVVGWENHR